MIEGLNVQLQSSQVASILKRRVEYHAAKVETYKKQIQIFAGEDTIEEAITKFSSNSSHPITGLQNNLKSHQKKIVYFQFLFDHLIPNDVYKLNTGDLNTLEITAY